MPVCFFIPQQVEQFLVEHIGYKIAAESVRICGIFPHHLFELFDIGRRDQAPGFSVRLTASLTKAFSLMVLGSLGA